MAGMPQSILDRANLLLKQLEEERSSDSSLKNDIGRAAARDNFQLSMFALEDPVLIRIRDGLKDLAVNALTPVAALLTLRSEERRVGKECGRTGRSRGGRTH